MDLYLVQHGLATSDEQDPRRPLTAVGREEAQRVTARLRAVGLRPDRCVHSDKLRARQTAEVLTAGLGIPLVEERAGLHPGDDVVPVAAWLSQQQDGGLVVVGHLPFLDRLASLLVAGREDGDVVRFHNAGVVALVPTADGARHSVDWALTPALA